MTAPTTIPRRSALYMPASNARAIAKARDLPCDVVILDLEDAVAPEAKDAARDQAVEAVRAGGFGPREVVIRANALDTPWGAHDLAAAAASGCVGVLLPKVSDTATLTRARAMLGTDVPLWAMIETCRAIVNLGAIVAAAAASGLSVLVAGTNDLAKEMRCRPGATRAPLLPILTQIVVAGRMAGLTVLDGVCNTIDDEAVVEAECRQGLTWGFDGKTLIHPAQVAVANRVFTPTADEVAWAREVDGAFAAPENAGKGAIRVSGKMVELLHLEEARRTLAIAQRVNAA
jgi:citrate lyase subunit beta/citryl-CoA lyase